MNPPSTIYIAVLDKVIAFFLLVSAKIEILDQFKKVKLGLFQYDYDYEALV